MADRPFNILSLCSGYGGLDLGVELALGGNARVVCGVEREAAAAAILGQAMGAGLVPAFPVWSDLRTFDGRPWRGVVDLITGGYPCQPFSFAGKRRGSDDPRHLWPAIARIVAEVEPGIVFFENVAGHVTLGFPAVRRELESLGFRVTAGLFTAEEVGAPHKRERLFILGVADDPARGCGELRPASGRDGRTEQDGGELADAVRKRGRGGATGRSDAAAVEAAGGVVADARVGLVPVAVWRSKRRDGAGSAGEVPLFPPGPGSSEWRRILAERPDLAPATQPAIRGVDDGSAAGVGDWLGRLDQLRALGNGVLPLTAATAFVTLWACLQGD